METSLVNRICEAAATSLMLSLYSEPYLFCVQMYCHVAKLSCCLLWSLIDRFMVQINHLLSVAISINAFIWFYGLLLHHPFLPLLDDTQHCLSVESMGFCRQSLWLSQINPRFLLFRIHKILPFFIASSINRCNTDFLSCIWSKISRVVLWFFICMSLNSNDTHFLRLLDLSHCF